MKNKKRNGFIQLMKFFDHSRAYTAGHGVGLVQCALDMTIKHVKGRHQFGRPLAAFQATQFKIAEMATKVETARNIVYKSAWLLDQGRPNTRLTAMAKMYACHVAVEVVDEALQLHGGYGYFNDYGVERFYRAAKVLEIYEGTKEVEKLVIFRELIGKLQTIFREKWFQAQIGFNFRCYVPTLPPAAAAVSLTALSIKKSRV